MPPREGDLVRRRPAEPWHTGRGRDRSRIWADIPSIPVAVRIIVSPLHRRRNKRRPDGCLRERKPRIPTSLPWNVFAGLPSLPATKDRLVTIAPVDVPRSSAGAAKSPVRVEPRRDRGLHLCDRCAAELGTDGAHRGGGLSAVTAVILPPALSKAMPGFAPPYDLIPSKDREFDPV